MKINTVLVGDGNPLRLCIKEYIGFRNVIVL